MDGLSQIAGPARIAVVIAVRAYLRDHRFGGRAVFPAVETMRLLAGTALGKDDRGGAVILRDARFPRFLTVPEDADAIDAVVETQPGAAGGVCARLATRFLSEKTAITREKTHGSLWVSQMPAPRHTDPPPAFWAAVAETGIAISPGVIYGELVPFGPAYRNIRKPLKISEHGALAALTAPELSAPESPLGSPFPLDAAFHAACTWGQRYAGVVAFPTAIAERTVILPTRTGETYTGWIRPVEAGPDRLVFDIWIHDEIGRLREAVSGVEMRDVTAGKWRPPAWIVAGAGDGAPP